MPFTHVFAAIAVTDIAAARAWYERLLGRSPDLVPHDREAAWRIAEAGWIYVVVDLERAGRSVATLLVDDLDAQIAELRSRGVDAGEVETLGSAARRIALVDPDGNRIAIGQPLTG